MKKRIPYKGKTIYVKTYNNIEGSICFIATRVGFGRIASHALVQYMTHVNLRGFLDVVPSEDAGVPVAKEIERLVDMQKTIIDDLKKTS